LKALFWTLAFTLSFSVKAQVSRELQEAINSVPFARFDYPANRDRNIPPQVASPQAYAFAYYSLPYAINLEMVADDLTEGYVGKVILFFNSVKLSSAEEKEILKKTVPQLQKLLDQQYFDASVAGFNARCTFSRSMIVRISANGRVIAIIREILSTRELINQLVQRMNAI
jgi:hypothetical protein